MTHRNAYSIMCVGVSWANKNLQENSSTTKTDEAAFRDKTPSGMRWNGYVQKVMTGSNGAGATAAKTAWDALSSSQSAWDTAALALTPPVGTAPQYA